MSKMKNILSPLLVRLRETASPTTIGDRGPELIVKVRAQATLSEDRPADFRERARRAIERLAEAGRVLSAANEEKLSAARDSIQAVLDSIGTDDTATDDAAATEARRKARQLIEAYSASAWDAADGAWLLSSLLGLISEEADEPDQVAMLMRAFDALNEWITAEVHEIGEPDDLEPELIIDWESAKPKNLAEAVVGDVVPLREGAIRSDGTAMMKIIQPGWGASGYYSAEVLERDGPKVFTAGTKNFWDHPTLSEEVERPERSLRDLAGELVTDAVYEADGPEGAGLYADARVISEFAPAVNELAPFIGVSIRALGTAHHGTVEGRSGPIIDKLIAAESVDYVTTPGAGGQVLSLFEAARRRPSSTPIKEATVDKEYEAKLGEAVKGRETAEQEAARLRERLILREARDLVATKLGEVEGLADITRKRLVESLGKNAPTNDKGELDEAALVAAIEEAVKEEAAYLAELTKSGKVTGFGGGPADDATAVTSDLAGSFARMGLSESASAVAAKGR